MVGPGGLDQLQQSHRSQVADIDRFFIAAKVTPAEMKKHRAQGQSFVCTGVKPIQPESVDA